MITRGRAHPVSAHYSEGGRKKVGHARGLATAAFVRSPSAVFLRAMRQPSVDNIRGRRFPVNRLMQAAHATHASPLITNSNAAATTGRVPLGTPFIYITSLSTVPYVSTPRKA